MKRFGYEKSKRQHTRFYKVMEGYESPSSETLYDIMEDIENLLNACYWLGINPLRELRHILPQYLWKYHKSTDRDNTLQTIGNSDFIWRVNWIDDIPGKYSETVELVTATKAGRSEPLRLFLAGSKKKLEESTPKLDFVRKQGGDPVYAEILDEEWMKTPEGQEWIRREI